MNKLKNLHPIYWSTLFFVLSQCITLMLAWNITGFLAENDLAVPEVSVGTPLAYFLGGVVLVGIVLFLVPVSKLKIVFRILFSLLFFWGLFVDFSVFVPLIAVLIISIGATLLWLFKPKIWLHDVLLVCSLTAVGAVFGTMISPWTAVILMIVLSVYDFLAVRFGYMMWMVKKLSKLDTLPAFVIPKEIDRWNMDIRETHVLEDESQERNFSLLGGGDIGFPLILISAVLTYYGLGDAVIIAAFALAGLGTVYWIQKVFLNGKPIAALPPITVACFVGFLIVYFT